MCYYKIVKVEEYIRTDGSCPYKKWFDSLEAEAAAKVTTAKIRMERGLTSSIEWFDGIGEYKIDWGPGYRIYLAKDGEELIVLFGGGTKKRQASDIQTAKLLFLEYKERRAKQKKEAEKVKKQNGTSEKPKR